MGDRDGQAVTLNNLGVLRQSQRNAARALDYYSRSLQRRHWRAMSCRGRLPQRSEIESAAEAFRDDLQKMISSPDEAGSDLSAMRLGPVAAQLGTKRLVIVGDGALQSVPFGALPAPAAPGQVSTARAPSVPLVVDHEIVYLPSASTLAALRHQVAGREAAPKTIAVLADAVFEPHDERLSAVLAGAGTKVHGKAATANRRDEVLAAAARQTTSATRQGISRLRFTKQEAAAILALTNKDEVFGAFGFAASKATSMSARLSQYRLVHFATHGFLNAQHPELSGVILSLYNEQGEPVDGFLRLSEVFDLKLPADLVVLSACQTGLGKELKGEGLVGLTRGFMYTGAPRVVISLWNVNDLATAALMTRFYTAMLGERLRPAAALRAAQIAMWKDQRWKAPYFWAAFVLQGDWK